MQRVVTTTNIFEKSNKTKKNMTLTLTGKHIRREVLTAETKLKVETGFESVKND